jgi:hypothetical protein
VGAAVTEQPHGLSWIQLGVTAVLLGIALCASLLLVDRFRDQRVEFVSPDPELHDGLDLLVAQPARAEPGDHPHVEVPDGEGGRARLSAVPPVEAFFTDHMFGSDRAALLAQHFSEATARAHAEHTQRVAGLEARVTAAEQAKRRLVREIERCQTTMRWPRPCAPTSATATSRRPSAAP